MSWSNLIPWIAQLLHVNIAPAPPPTSICLVYSTVNNLHVNVTPPPPSSCHFSLSFAFSVWYSIPKNNFIIYLYFGLTIAHM